MGDIIHTTNGFREWKADFLERFPRYNISLPDSPVECQLKNVGRDSRLTALSPDGSIAAVATLKKIKLYRLEGTRPVPISFKLKLGRSDMVRACDISVNFLAVATLTKLLVYAFRRDLSPSSSPLVDVDISRGSYWTPTCLTLLENQQASSRHFSSSWAWVAVGGEQGVKLFLLRRHATWNLQSNRPILWSGIESVRGLAASPNLSEDPYASILAGACEGMLLFWDLRQRGPNDQNPFHPTAAIPVPCQSVSLPNTRTALGLKANSTQSIRGRRITSATTFISPSGPGWFWINLIAISLSIP